MHDPQIRKTLRDFIARFVRMNDYGDDEDIVASRAINSLFMMQLVLFIEKQFALTVENEDLELRNFSSVDAMVRFIDGKRATAGAGSAA